MPKKEIFYEMTLATGQPIKSIKDLEVATKQLEKTLKASTDIGSEGYKKMQDAVVKGKSEILAFNRELRGSAPIAQRVSEGVTDAFKHIGAQLLAAFSIDRVIEFGMESVKVFQEAEENAHKLAFAIEQVNGEGGQAFEKLIKQSQELQEKGIFSDDAIQKADTQLANFGLTSDQIQKLIPVITDLAAASGTDLATATDKVIQGINGQTKGLKEFGVVMEDSGSKTKNLATLTDQLSKFQGANAEALTTSAGAAKHLENSFNDLQEKIGGFLNTSLTDFKQFAGALFNLFQGKGSIRDAVEEGVEGFVKASTSGLVDLETHTESIERRVLEKKAIFQNFTAKQLVDSIALQQQIIKKGDKAQIEEAKFTLTAIGRIYNERKEEERKSLIAQNKDRSDLTQKGLQDQITAATKLKEEVLKFRKEQADAESMLLKDDLEEQRRLREEAAKKQLETIKALTDQVNEALKAGVPLKDAEFEAFFKETDDLFGKLGENLGLTKQQFDELAASNFTLLTSVEQGLRATDQLGQAFGNLGSVFEDALGKQNAFATAAVKLQQAEAAAIAVTNAVLAVQVILRQGLGTFPKNLVGIFTTLAAVTGAVASIKKLATPTQGFAGGGPTGKGFGSPDASGHRVAGVVHANEYVVPKTVLESPRGSSLVAALEGMRTRGFAAGGYTSGVPVVPELGLSNALLAKIATGLGNLDLKPEVSVVEVTRAQRRVAAIENIGKLG